MSEDPRWQRALKLLEQAAAAYDRGDTAEMTRAFENYCNTLDGLAVDPAVPRDQRRRAAKLMDKIDALIAANSPALLHRLAERANGAADADARAEFAAMLAHAAERLPAASQARH
jgi:uncharacterized protein (UPF0147 family)